MPAGGSPFSASIGPVRPRPPFQLALLGLCYSTWLGSSRRASPVCVQLARSRRWSAAERQPAPGWTGRDATRCAMGLCRRCRWRWSPAAGSGAQASVLSPKLARPAALQKAASWWPVAAPASQPAADVNPPTSQHACGVSQPYPRREASPGYASPRCTATRPPHEDAVSQSDRARAVVALAVARRPRPLGAAPVAGLPRPVRRAAAVRRPRDVAVLLAWRAAHVAWHLKGRGASDFAAWPSPHHSSRTRPRARRRRRTVEWILEAVGRAPPLAPARHAAARAASLAFAGGSSAAWPSLRARRCPPLLLRRLVEGGLLRAAWAMNAAAAASSASAAGSGPARRRGFRVEHDALGSGASRARRRPRALRRYFGLSGGLGVAGALRLVGVGPGLGGDLLRLLDAALLLRRAAAASASAAASAARPPPPPPRPFFQIRRPRPPSCAPLLSPRLLGAPLLLGFCFFFGAAMASLVASRSFRRRFCFLACLQ